MVGKSLEGKTTCGEKERDGNSLREKNHLEVLRGVTLSL